VDEQMAFRKAFERIENRLVKKIEVDSGLWIELRARKVLLDQQINTCRAKVCNPILGLE